MSTKLISTVTFSVDQNNQISGIDCTFTSGEKTQTTQIVIDTLEALSLQEGAYKLNLTDKLNLTEKPLTTIDSASKETATTALSKTTIEKITKAFQRQFAYDNEINPTYLEKSKEAVERSLKKSIINGVDSFFRKRIIHAKLADIATLLLFATVISICVISIIHPGSLGMLHFFNSNILPGSNLAFAITTSSVGLVLFYQSILNYQKAKKSMNKEEMKLAIFQALFSVVIMGLGTMGILSAMNLSNQIIFRLLFGMCSSYMLGLGIYNLRKTWLLRKKLNAENSDLQATLKKLLQIQEEEQNEIETKIAACKKDQIDEWLKKILTKEKFEEIQKQAQNIEKKKELILLTELEMLQKGKLSYFESIVGKDILNKCINYLNRDFLINSKLKQTEENSLREAINSSIKIKLLAEFFRILSPILGLFAFGFDLSFSFHSFTLSKNIESLIYTSIMFATVAISSPLNYVKRLRNVPIEEKNKGESKTAFDHLIPKLNPSS